VEPVKEDPVKEDPVKEEPAPAAELAISPTTFDYNKMLVPMEMLTLPGVAQLKLLVLLDQLWVVL